MSAAPTGGAVAPLVRLTGVSKSFGSTRANRNVAFEVRPGEVVGLIGANGAGKSTLMSVLTGGATPDDGVFAFGGSTVDWNRYGPRQAHRFGIRIVHQELSLCPNLTAAENFFLEDPDAARLSPFWLGRYRAAVRDAMAQVFPSVAIDADIPVGRLDIAARQMLEIARTLQNPALRLLILDEPTSSLALEQAQALHKFIAKRAAKGLGVIFISHKLREVLAVADRLVAMRNGAVVWDRPKSATTLDALVEVIGAREAFVATAGAAPARDGRVLARLTGEMTKALGRDVDLHGGEVVGLAGLDGQGQKALLRRLFASEAAQPGGVQRLARASYVSGDRQAEGVFPLWSVLDNIAIGRIARWPAARPVRRATEIEHARTWAERLALAPERLADDILALSGGNQQKALLARGLIDDAPLVLLDDPTRGVDIGAKRDFYRVLRRLSEEGRLTLWRSTEDVEMLECDRVLVMRDGQVVADLAGDAITEQAVIGAGFGEGAPPVASRGRWAGEGVFAAVPFIGLALLLALMWAMNPLVLSAFGMQLLLGPAVVLVLVALAQMFVVGGSEIDLSVGAFVGMVNVLSATLLVTAPVIGALALAAGLAGYALMAALIRARAIPAIVVTLGASFIWSGVGRTIQPSPGGGAPDWLRAAVGWKVAGVPTPLLLILAAGLIAFAVDRAPLGVVLRAFGSHPNAVARAGWSPLRHAVWRYLIAGCFAGAAGLYLTATNGASDVNAGAAYTHLSVAGVVVGGCALLGGYIAPAGVVAGAVTLALIGAALGLLGVSTDFNALVQGALLVAILGMRTLFGLGRRDA